MGDRFIVKVIFLGNPIQDVKDEPSRPLFEICRVKSQYRKQWTTVSAANVDERTSMSLAGDLSVIEYGLGDANTDQV